jgi:amidohydrolase
MAAPDIFEITIRGKGGHAAMPHQVVDSIAVGAQVVTNLQHVVSRETDPIDHVVVSVTKFSGGTTHNVIPGTVEMVGTVRTLDPEVRERVPELMERVIKGVTEAHGADYEFRYKPGYRPVINAEEVTSVIEETVRDAFGEGALEIMPPNMGGEDFSAYQQKAPGAFFLVGAGNEEKGIVNPHHHPRFTIDEDALDNGVRMFLGATFRLLDGAGRGET